MDRFERCRHDYFSVFESLYSERTTLSPYHALLVSRALDDHSVNSHDAKSSWDEAHFESS